MKGAKRNVHSKEKEEALQDLLSERNLVQQRQEEVAGPHLFYILLILQCVLALVLQHQFHDEK